MGVQVLLSPFESLAGTLATNLQNCSKVLDLVKSQSHRWASVKSLETLYLTGATKSALMLFPSLHYNMVNFLH